MNYKSFINDVLLDASEIASEMFGKVSGTIKGGDSNQVLTKADLAIGALIIQKIKNDYPDYNIIDEEAGGIYTDFFGKPIDYSNPLKRAKQNFTVCAAPPALHKQLQDIIHHR